MFGKLNETRISVRSRRANLYFKFELEPQGNMYA